MAVGVRIRFEVFKRDAFTCRYCGRQTPDVVLEVDHIVPVCEGGSDDPMNLATSCWDCNRGKRGELLSHVITGEDPHDRAITLLESQRQLREYDRVVSELLNERIATADSLFHFWCEETRAESVPKNHYQWLVTVLAKVPSTYVKDAMMIAIGNNRIKDWRYVMAIVKNKRRDAGEDLP